MSSSTFPGLISVIVVMTAIFTIILARLMREDFWPFVSACAVIFSSSLLVAVYGIKRTWFTEQKVDYGTYESANQV